MKYKLDVNSILWKEGGGGLWRFGRAEACSLSSSLMVLRFAGGGIFCKPAVRTSNIAITFHVSVIL